MARKCRASQSTHQPGPIFSRNASPRVTDAPRRVFSHPPAEKRQTMLFSATQTRKVEDLARISLKKEPLYVGVDDNKESATVDGLEQVTVRSGGSGAG